jgi:hypothetical protein
MILVVALLGILFVAGAAFLQDVGFTARVLTADAEAREQEALVDLIEQVVLDRLNDGWLTDDGLPYVPPPDVDLGSMDLQNHIRESLWPVVPAVKDVDPPDGWKNAPLRMLQPGYSAPVGVDSTLSAIAPYEAEEPDVVCGDDASAFSSLYSTMTDFNRVLRGEALGPIDFRIDTPRTCWEFWGEQMYAEDTFPPPDPGDVTLMDADGDGIADSVATRILATELLDNPDLLSDFEKRGLELARSFPAVQRKAMIDQLRASDATSDEFLFGVRVVSHGGMANLKYGHPNIINGVLSDLYTEAGGYYDPPGDEYLIEPEKYDPAMEESFLRYRNIVPPRTLVDSALIRDLRTQYLDPDDGENPFLISMGVEPGSDGTFASHRWWRFDPIADAGQGGLYRILFDATQTEFGQNPGSKSFDRRHLSTVTSFDDLVVRGVRFPVELGLDQQEIAGYMRERDPSRRFFRDNYPDNLPGASLADEAAGIAGDEIDPRVGRLQLSIPWLEEWLADNGLTIDDIGKLPVGQADREHFVRMIQDTFWMMLWNHPDLDRNGSHNAIDDRFRSQLAASLTANFIDFADGNDPQHTPTEVVVVGNDGRPLDFDGDGTPESVFGIERQPYITEVYTELQQVTDPRDLVAATSVFAIELYNPYGESLSLADYALTDLTTDPHPDPFRDVATGFTLERLGDDGDGPIALTELGLIGPGVYKTIKLFGDAPTGAPFDRPESSRARQMVFYDDSQIALLRNVGSVGNPRYIVVDMVDINDGAPYVDDQTTGSSDICKAEHIGSIQRDTSTYADPELQTTDSLWRMTVPRAVKLARPLASGPSRVGTPGAPNQTLAETQDHNIRPVQIDCANTGSLVTAYPTTGCLLLLMRHAHLYDADDGSVTPTPANRVVTALNDFAFDYTQIDNGRMPIFDIGTVSWLPRGGDPLYHNPPIDIDPDPDGVADVETFKQLMRGRPQGLESLPWGAFVFDYFTAVPLDNPFGYEFQEEFQKPKVDQGGLRVYGRVDITSAPWKVLAGLPLRPSNDLPAVYRNKLKLSYLGSGEDRPAPIGPALAKSIVAYRDGREIPSGGGGFGTGTGDYGFRTSKVEPDLTDADEVDRLGYVAGMRQGRGFLSVGELANVRYAGSQSFQVSPDFRIDFGVIGRTRMVTVAGSPQEVPNEDYIKAIGLLVGLEDWVTTRSHVYTIYGVIQGPTVDRSDAGYGDSVAEAESKAIRFQETVNRLPSFFNRNASPQRIGDRIIGSYREGRGE